MFSEHASVGQLFWIDQLVHPFLQNSSVTYLCKRALAFSACVVVGPVLAVNVFL